MAVRNLSADDITAAIQQQNIQVAAGQIGQPPVPKGQVFQYTMTYARPAVTLRQFASIWLSRRTPTAASSIWETWPISNWALSYDQTATLDGSPRWRCRSTSCPVQRPEGFAAVKAKMEELRARFPKGLNYKIVYDTTPFINESINEVYKTLFYAVVLVAAVVLLFLQNWRSAIIPLIAVPVAIIGTLAVMAAIGFSLNNLTLFGLVLAIGIVVDDAIVVVEAVEFTLSKACRLMTPPSHDGAGVRPGGRDRPGAGRGVRAVRLISGITGQFFRQFALTIAVSTLISMFVSLTLSPALSALLLRPRREGHYEALPRLAFVLILGFLAYLLAVMPETAAAAQWWDGLAPNNPYMPTAYLGRRRCPSSAGF